MKTDTATNAKANGKAKYNKGTLPRSNDLEEMYKIVGQAQVAFIHLLKGFHNLNEITFQKIMKGFLQNCILKENNWQQAVHLTEIQEKENQEEVLNSKANILRTSIGKYVAIEVSSLEYSCCKNSIFWKNLYG